MNKPTKIMPGAITHTLLIWEMGDRRAVLVLIPNKDLNADDFAMFRIVHGKALNADDCTKEQTDRIKSISEDLSMRLNGEGKPSRFGQYIVDDGCGNVTTPIEEKIITRIYRTGWFW